MTTRDEHRDEAQKLLRLAARESWLDVGEQHKVADTDLVAEYIAAAQVHAILALSAPEHVATGGGDGLAGVRQVFKGGAA